MQLSESESSNKESEWSSIEPALPAEQKNEYLSVCDIWKDNVHRVITKMEYQTPLYLQAYSQVHSEFLHSVDNLFGTCYIWQKQYFDRLGIDKNVIATYGKLCESMMDNLTGMMDLYANYKKFQADTAVEALKIGNNYMHWWIDMFGRSVAFWNNSWNSTKKT